MTELEAALRDADRRIAEAVAEATRTATQTKRDEETRLSGELRAAQLESSSLKLRLAETEEALRASEALASEGEGAVAELAMTRVDADAARTELEELRLGFQRAKLELQAAHDELDGSRTELQASGAEVHAARTELEVSRGELEVSRGERDRALGELERLRGERDDAAAEVQGSRAEVQGSRTELEVSRSERDRAVAELERVRGELDEMGAEVRRLSAERAVPEGGVVDGGAAASGHGEAVSGPRLAQMEARIAEMETRRRTDVAELQRAQESLANTQVELMEANRMARASEERLRELEGGVAAPSRGAPELAYSPASSEDEEPVWAFESSDAGLESNSAASGSDELAGGSDEPESEESPEEALSLRERLSRAAAARHRTVQPRD